MHEEGFWIPRAEQPLADLVAEIQADDAEIDSLVGSPRRQLAFRTFAYLRVGVLLGELLVDRDLPLEQPDAWVEALLADEETRASVVEEVRAVAREVAGDPRLAEEDMGADAEARNRLRRFARESLED